MVKFDKLGNEIFVRESDVNPTEQHYLSAQQQISNVIKAGASYAAFMRGDFVDDETEELNGDQAFPSDDPVDIQERQEKLKSRKKKEAAKLQEKKKELEKQEASPKVDEKVDNGGTK